MLCLGRREEQKLIFSTSDGDIVVTIRKCLPSSVRLGIVAPKDVKVLRDEFFGKEKPNGTRQRD